MADKMLFGLEPITGVPSKEEVKAEADKLKFMKPYIRQYSYFGDNNHQKVDIEIDVLGYWLSHNGQCMDTERIMDDKTRETADDTNEWLQHGSQDGTLSQQWEPLLTIAIPSDKPYEITGDEAPAPLPKPLLVTRTIKSKDGEPSADLEFPTKEVKTKETKKDDKSKTGAGRSGKRSNPAGVRRPKGK